MIKEIDERENYIIRKSVNLSKQTHIIAANIDQAFCWLPLTILLLSQLYRPVLVTAEAYHIRTIILFNKIDSYNEEELGEIKFLAALYRSIGYECLGISAKTGKNVDKVKEMMTGKTSMISGHSGTGKSTLVNALESSLHLKTAVISEQHKQGQHTTTFAEMYDLSFDARIIDTPGIKGFGVVDMEKDEIGNYFPEFCFKTRL